MSDIHDKGYQNKITAIQEIATVSGTNVIISFEHDDPVCSYAPASYQESIDDEVSRFFMPRTVIAEGVTTSLDLEQFDHGVQLVLLGRLVQKFIGGKNILIKVKDSTDQDFADDE